MNSIFHQDVLFSLLLGQCRVAFAAVMAIFMLGHEYAGSTCCILTLNAQTANFVIVVDLGSECGECSVKKLNSQSQV
jgi:hypothetical protein